MSWRNKGRTPGLTPVISDEGIESLAREVLANESPAYEPEPDVPADFEPPPPDGPHTYKRQDSGGWKCSVCAKVEADPRELGAKTCLGKR